MEEQKFSLQLRMLTALEFLPPQDVVRGFATVFLIRLEETMVMLQKNCYSLRREHLSKLVDFVLILREEMLYSQ